MALDAQGIVHLRGAMSQGGAFNATAFTLPAEFRPSALAYVPIDLVNAKKGRLIVRATGVVDVQAENASADAQGFTSLEGATWSAG